MPDTDGVIIPLHTNIAMILLLLVAGLLLVSLNIGKPYVIHEGDIYPLPDERLSIEMILKDPKFKDMPLDDLPEAFWLRQTRLEVIQLAQKYGLQYMLEVFVRNNLVDVGKGLIFSADGHYILYDVVEPSKTGFPVLKTLITKEKLLNIFEMDDVTLQKFGTMIMPILSLDSVLEALDGHAIFKITKFFTSGKIANVFEPDFDLDIAMAAEQSVAALLNQLLYNDGFSFPEHEVRELALMIIHSNDNLHDNILKWSFLRRPNPDSLMGLILKRVNLINFRKYEGNHTLQLRYLLTVWKDQEVVPHLVAHLLDKYGVNSFTEEDWVILLSIPARQLIKYAPVLIYGVLLGKVPLSYLVDLEPEFGRLIVMDQESKSICLETCKHHLNVYGPVFSWLSVQGMGSITDDIALKLVEFDMSSGREALLKKLVIDEYEHLLEWFWKLYGSGQAQFPAATLTFKKKIISMNPELGFLAFPEEFEQQPPVRFSKHTILKLIRLGPVNGRSRSIFEPFQRLLEIKLELFSLEELLELQTWGRNSEFGYRIGNMIHTQIEAKGGLNASLDMSRVKLLLSDWEKFPCPNLFENSLCAFDGFRALLSWTNYKLEADVMRSFEVMLNMVGKTEVVFLKHTIPNTRNHARQLIQFRYCFIENQPGCHQPDLQSFVVKIHDPSILVQHARQPYDSTSLSVLKSRFIAFGYEEQVWRMTKFVPQNEVWQYLFLIKVWNNIPFGFFEFLRVHRKMPISEMDEYIKGNIIKPRLY